MFSSDKPTSWDTRVRPQVSNSIADRVGIDGENPTTLVQLSAGCRLEGKLSVDGDAVMNCELIGELQVSGELLVGQQARIEGKASAERLIVAGFVRGDLQGNKRLELKAGSDVEGTLSSPSLVIEDGVRFVGQCSMPKNSTSTKAETEGLKRGNQWPSKLNNT